MTTDELNKKIKELKFFITTEQKENARVILTELSELYESTQEENARVVLTELSELYESTFIIFAKYLQQIADNITQIIDDILESIIQLYPNTKIVNLALHHPKAKVRKKNKRRIFKWLKKMLYYDFQHSAERKVIM